MKLMGLFLLSLIIGCSHFQASAQESKDCQIKMYDGRDLIEKADFESLFQDVQPGEVIVMGEIHDNLCHHANHLNALKILQSLYPNQRVHVAMEFISFEHQEVLDAYLNKEISEEEFLVGVDWRGDFSPYRDKILFPSLNGGRAFGINSPRELSGAIARGGIDSLSDEQKRLLPPNFERGREIYFERFIEVMTHDSGHDLPREFLENYFWAQSLWDDTMAYTTLRWSEKYSEDIMVIIVGDFHVAYGGGLPDRLLQRGAQNIRSISQVHSDSFSEQDQIDPSGPYGHRADFIIQSVD